MSSTIETRSPTTLLNIVDFPTLGLPTIATIGFCHKLILSSKISIILSYDLLISNKVCKLSKNMVFKTINLATFHNLITIMIH